MGHRERVEALVTLVRERYEAARDVHGALAQLSKDSGLDPTTITRLGKGERSGLSPARVDAVEKRWAAFRARLGEPEAPAAEPSRDALRDARALLMEAQELAGVDLPASEIQRALRAALGCSSVQPREQAVELLVTFLRGVDAERRRPVPETGPRMKVGGK